MTTHKWRYLLMLVLSLALLVSCRRDRTPPPTPTPVAAVTATPSPVPTATAEPESELLQLTGSATPAPRLISRRPAPGAELALDAPIELVFDQPMDSARTAAALQVVDAAGAPVDGTVTWPQARILRFQPRARLLPDSRYQVILAADAASALGATLLEGLTLDVGTVGDIAVSQIAPTDGTEFVDPNSAVTVIFNRPVVPLLMGAARAQLASPLVIEPATDGTGEWVNTSVFVFRPNQPLLGRQTYTVRVDPAVVNELSATGAVMTEPAASSFTVTPPTFGYLRLDKMRLAYPYDNFPDLPLDETLQLFFAQPMDPATTEAAVSMVPRSGDPASYTFAWSDDFTTLTMTPTQLLALGMPYTLTVDDSAESATGGRLDRPFTWTTTTVQPPAIVATDPADGATQRRFASSFGITFASPMDPDSLQDKITVTPPTLGDTNGQYSRWDWTLRLFGFEPSTTYTVRIAPGMADPYGNRIEEETVITFTTTDRDPYVSLNVPGQLSLYRQGGTTAAWVTYRNVERVDAQLFRLLPPQFADLAAYSVDRSRYTPPSDQLVWSEQRAVAAERNTRAYTRFDLADLEPGLYYLTLDAPGIDKFGARYVQTQPILIANANVTLKTTTTEALVWVTDLDSGAPLPGVTVRLADRPTLGGSPKGTDITLVTDADGVAYADGLTLSPDWGVYYYALVESDGVFGAAINQWDEGTQPYDFNIGTDYYLQPNQPASYVYTDRPIYRPGQPVHIKGIVRLNDDLTYALPDFENVRVEITHYDGLLTSQRVPLSPLGTFELTVELDGEATLGYYNIGVQRENGEWIGSGYFDVAEYRKPTFRVDVATDRSDIAAGEAFAVTTTATFFSGGAVVNGVVDWNVSAQEFVLTPGGRYGRYSFTDFDRDAGRYADYFYGPYRPNDYLGGGQGTTDGSGRYTFPVAGELGESAVSRLFTIETTVTDIARNAVSGRVTGVVHAGRVYAGIRPNEYIGTVGDETAFDLVALDWAAQPVADQPVDVRIVERRWYSVQEENEFGETIWRTSVEEIGVLTETVTLGADGSGSVTFLPPRGGVYKAYASAVDADGGRNTAAATVWVAGSGYVAWRRVNDHSFDLIADSDSYAPGETAAILIASPFQGEATALITVERGHIKSYDVVPLTGNSTVYNLPVTGDMAPNVFVSALVMKGIDADNPYPDFKIGYTQFTVARTEQELAVTITPDKTEAGPRDDVTFTVTVRDHAGEPVSAELSLALVDLAALTLANPNAPPVLDFFYSTRWLSVRTALLLTLNMDGFNQELEDQIKGGGGGGDGGGVILIREDFPDTAHWTGQLTTDADGTAQVTITLPDNLTTWRMDVRAVTADTLVGQATSDLIATLPLLIDPVTPRFFVQGDRATVSALVHNNTDAPLDVKAQLDAEGVTLSSAAEQALTVPARRQAVVSWDLIVNDVDRADFVFSVAGGGFADASRPTLGTLEGQGIPVYRYTVPETVGTSGQLLDGGVAVESIGLPVFPGFTLDEGTLTVSVAPSLAAAMTDGLTYLEHFPYECTEQIVSKFLPNVLSTRALREAGIDDPDLEAALAAQVNLALQKLYARQRSDGGWPWWDGQRTDTLVTAYVVLGLHEAREAGYTVADGVIRSGVRYLTRNLSEVDRLTGRYKFNRQAFLVYVLATVDEAPTRPLNNLFDNRDALDLYAQAWLAQALYLTDPGDPRVATLQANLTGRAILSATGANWEEAERDWWNWGSDVRTTAIVLDALVQLDPDNPLVANAVRWLMAHRDAGRWQGTQETAWAIMALTDFMVASGELTPAYDYEVALNGELIAAGTATPESVRATRTLALDVSALLADELNRLAIGRTDGDGNLYYTAHMRLALPVDQVPALDQGVTISRQYFDPADRETPIDSAPQGATFLARLTIVVPNTLHYVLIEDWLPAGLEAVDTSLLTSQQVGAPELIQVPSNYTWEDFVNRGWGWWVFEHVELRDEKVVLSAETLPAGTYEYVYLVRAATPGVFQVIPPTAAEFYFPEVNGRGAGALFTVTP